MSEFHLLRPYWLGALIPLAMLCVSLWKQKTAVVAWRDICDAHLLPHLLQTRSQARRIGPLLLMMSSALCMIIALAGPTWSRLPVPTYKPIQPRVIVLDMSEDMLNRDMSPDRLTRAKFKLHDMLQRHDVGQFALMVYTGEPFVVSPLTDDGQTIDALLASLTPDIMPITGNRLDTALEEASKIITETGSQSGELLVLTSTVPSPEAVSSAGSLANKGIHVSVLPILNDKNAEVLFEPLAKAGQGKVIVFSNDNTDIDLWLHLTHASKRYQANHMDNIPLWHDEGRWFLIPALLLLLPVFWRGWLQRVYT